MWEEKCATRRADSAMFSAMRRRMPTTLIVDRSGCEIGTMAGPAEWASDDGVKLVSAAIDDDNGAVTR